MELQILANVYRERRKCVWVSLQPPKATLREAISVGFADRSFLVSRVESHVALEERTHVTAMDLQAEHGLSAVTNPHFTFHAPAWMHLRANGGEALLEQLIPMDIAIVDGNVPWLRFISKAVRHLPRYLGRRNPDVEEIDLYLATGDESIDVQIDFIASPEYARDKCGQLLNRIVEWHGWLLHLTANPHSGRTTSTFTWFQQT